MKNVIFAFALFGSFPLSAQQDTSFASRVSSLDETIATATYQTDHRAFRNQRWRINRPVFCLPND